MSTLVIADASGQMLRRIDLFGLDRLTIGRSTQRDLIINDPAISRFHCILYFEAGEWCIADAGSRSGTRIDGHAVVWKRLPPGRTASLGHLLLWIEPAAESEAVALEHAGRNHGKEGGGLAPGMVNHAFSLHAEPETAGVPEDACGRTSIFLTSETDFLNPADRIPAAGR